VGTQRWLCRQQRHRRQFGVADAALSRRRSKSSPERFEKSITVQNDALISSQPRARLNAKMKNAIDPREIVDEERQQKAAPGSTIVDGDGTS
jgi:hypothetical protein